MKRQHIAIVLVSAAIVYACAPRNRVTVDGAANKQPSRTAAAAPTLPDTSGLTLSVTTTKDSRGMGFALEYRNGNKNTELRFASGRTHDFVVLDDKDREVWRWSAERLFTQAMQTKQLRKGDVLRYETTWTSDAPGTYRVVAMLNTSATTEPLGQQFIIP